MAWHQKHSTNAAYTFRDASLERPVCPACVYGSMHQTRTDHRRKHREPTTVAGQQFSLDAYSHNTVSYRRSKYCDLLTDLATGHVYPLYTKDRSSVDLCHQATMLFVSHPSWKDNPTSCDRFVRADPERSYHSKEFIACLSAFGYRIERTPARDKHANGVAERTVGVIATKTNIAMLAPSPPVPQQFWELAMTYTCVTHSFNYNHRINDSPYHYITGSAIDVKQLHPFWARCYVHIPLKDRNSKIGCPRAYNAHFVGYDYTSTLTKTYFVIEIHSDGTYGKVRSSKDVIFDQSLNFNASTDIVSPDTASPDTASHDTVPPVNASPVTAPLSTDLPVPAPILTAPALKSSLKSKPPPVIAPTRTPKLRTTFNSTNRYDRAPPPVPVVRGDLIDYNSLKDFTEPDLPTYWYNYQTKNPEYPLTMVETSHWLLAADIKEPTVPKSFFQAMKDPEWAAAVNKERSKFELNDCLAEVPYTNQHLVPMMWLFSIKTDGTKKARLVGRGDMMIPWVDFDPNAVYCGNVSASSIKIAMTIAAMYKLDMRGGDLVGAYLVTLANPDYPVHIKTPQGYIIKPNHCIQAVGNLYGFPPAGQNFSKEFDRCVKECGYNNTPWDLKFFYKWISGKPIIIIAHSDDFRWFGPKEYLNEWDILVKTFNKHKYEVTDATTKEFVGIHIYHDEEYNYYMDQTRMINSIIADANMTGAPDAKLPYPIDGPNLSKADCATDEQKQTCSKYPFRKVVGQLMYGMVHTMVTIMYALNVLSRYGINPGPRHIEFLKHLLRYVKHSKDDRLKFTTHNGPTDIITMTELMQLSFQCDADLGGNLDNGHSQTSYLGYLAGSLICWCSTDQGSVSTSTAESEIKAVNHTLKCEVIANRGILNQMGWKQAPTIIEEDNSACVASSEVTHITRGLRHLDLAQFWFKEKVADKTCIVTKVASKDNNADIGTKRLLLPLFNALSYKLVDKTLRKNL